MEEALLDIVIPRLILQPIVENAVEHDLTPRRGGHLAVRVRREGDLLRLEVEHDGQITAEERAQIDALLSGEPDGNGAGKVGLRNVRERLALLYGERASLTIEQAAADSILAAISLPLDG